MRSVIGKVPPWLVRFGTIVVAAVVVALGVAFYYVPYPISIDAKGTVLGKNAVRIYVPYRYLYLFDEPRVGYVLLEGGGGTSCQFRIVSHDNRLVHTTYGNYFTKVSHPKIMG